MWDGCCPLSFFFVGERGVFILKLNTEPRQKFVGCCACRSFGPKDFTRTFFCVLRVQTTASALMMNTPKNYVRVHCERVCVYVCVCLCVYVFMSLYLLLLCERVCVHVCACMCVVHVCWETSPFAMEFCVFLSRITSRQSKSEGVRRVAAIRC